MEETMNCHQNHVLRGKLTKDEVEMDSIHSTESQLHEHEEESPNVPDQ